jgi:hypothetical protein
MAFKVQDLVIHLSPVTQAKTAVWLCVQNTDNPSICSPNSCGADEDRGCPAPSCPQSGPPKPKPGGGQFHEVHLAALRQRLRQTLEARP